MSTPAPATKSNNKKITGYLLSTGAAAIVQSAGADVMHYGGIDLTVSDPSSSVKGDNGQITVDLLAALTGDPFASAGSLASLGQGEVGLRARDDYIDVIGAGKLGQFSVPGSTPALLALGGNVSGAPNLGVGDVVDDSSFSVNGKFGPSPVCPTDCSLGAAGGYVGLRLTGSAGANFGWLRYTADPGTSFGGPSSLTLNELAIESDLNTSIVAGAVPQAVQAVPEPGTLALLATGLVGLVGLRRRRIIAA